MPFSIDYLSIKAEAQKVALGSDDMEHNESHEHNNGIFKIQGLVEQEPITIF